MARCMSIACIRVPALRLRFRIIVRTVMFPMAEITISMLYVIMVTTWPSLNRISYGMFDSSNMDWFVTLSIIKGDHENKGCCPATTPLVTECSTSMTTSPAVDNSRNGLSSILLNSNTW